MLKYICIFIYLFIFFCFYTINVENNLYDLSNKSLIVCKCAHTTGAYYTHACTGGLVILFALKHTHNVRALIIYINMCICIWIYQYVHIWIYILYEMIYV